MAMGIPTVPRRQVCDTHVGGISEDLGEGVCCLVARCLAVFTFDCHDIAGVWFEVDWGIGTENFAIKEGS
jgi:hypothetical protein